MASLGAALAELGQRVLLVDLDPQACLTFSLGLDPDALELSVHDVLLGRVPAAMALQPTDDGVDLLPAAIDLTGSEARLVTRAGREFVLREALAEVSPDYDWVLLDCSPSLGVLTLNALTAADARPDPAAVRDALAPRRRPAPGDRRRGPQAHQPASSTCWAILPTLFDGRTTHARAVLADVADALLACRCWSRRSPSPCASPRRPPPAGRCCRTAPWLARARRPTASTPAAWSPEAAPRPPAGPRA